MGYRIVYEGPDGNSPKKDRGRLAGYTAGFLLLFFLLTQIFWPAGADKMRKILLPWDPDVTAEAFSCLVTDLNQGEDLSEAVTAFCREIILNAEYPD